MAVVNDLINVNSDSLEFGNYELTSKTKKDGFEFKGDIYKIKTFNEITKLERNGMFVYESVPGTAVHDFISTEDTVVFSVEGTETSSITLELEAETEYKIHIDDIYVGKNKTNLGGKINISVDLEPGRLVKVEVVKAID
ncbi:MAG: endosialidase [Coprococcus sp.]